MGETGKSFIQKLIGFSIVPWVSFILSFIAAPISTRLFDPDVLGKINIFNTYSNLFGILVLVGLDQAYARFFNERPNNRTKGFLFTFCVSITYAVLFVSFILALPFKQWISLNLFQEQDNLLFFLFFISVLCYSTLRYLNLTYRMEQDIRMYTFQGILMVLVSKVLYISVGFWDPSYKPALVVLTFSHLLLAIVFLFIQHDRFEIIKEKDHFFSKELFSFALPLIPVSILSWANSSIPQLVMQRSMDYYSIGVFTSAMGLANVILIVQSGFNTFWVPYTYENYKTQTGQFFKVHKYLMCVLVLFALLLICFQDVVFLLLGEKYRQAKTFFPFLILGPVCYIAGEVSGVGIEIAKKTYLKLVVFVASIIVNVAGCIFLSKPFGIAGIAMATSLAAIVAMLILTLIGDKFYKVILNYKYLTVSVFSIIASACATLWVTDIVIRLCLTIFILFFSSLFFRKEIQELWKVAMSFFRNN